MSDGEVGPMALKILYSARKVSPFGDFLGTETG